MNFNFFQNKKILITGACGSIGSSVILELIKNYKFKVLRALSNDENGLFGLSQKINPSNLNFNQMMKSEKVRLICGDIRNYSRCLEASLGVDIIIHAAAMKHVPICEYNPSEAFQTNIVGTENICKAAVANNVKKVIFISTDKAVNPQTLMGTTKLMGEKIVLNSNEFSPKNKTMFCCIRFGNVIGSRGSVLEIFKSQIENDNKLTLTDEKMTRFFIDLSFAAKRILKVVNEFRGGEIFIIKSMNSFKIIDLANVLIEYYGKKTKIKKIGIRKNEKIFEEILTDKEFEYAVENKYFIILNNNYTSINNSKFYGAKKIKDKKNLKSNNKFSLTKKDILNFLKVNKLV